MGCRTSLAIAGMAAAFLNPGALDAAADDYFKGKDITIYVGSTSGGPYDAYARMLARHWGRHLCRLDVRRSV
jgi:hypothetical protein